MELILKSVVGGFCSSSRRATSTLLHMTDRTTDHNASVQTTRGYYSLMNRFTSLNDSTKLWALKKFLP